MIVFKHPIIVGRVIRLSPSHVGVVETDPDNIIMDVVVCCVQILRNSDLKALQYRDKEVKVRCDFCPGINGVEQLGLKYMQIENSHTCSALVYFIISSCNIH